MKPLARALLALVILLPLACQRPRARPARAPGPELIEAGSGPVDEVVRSALADAQRDHRRLLVYVSAIWCKPCERFQAAIRAGELNAYFPELRMLKFDHDRDFERLRVAGYGGELLPRFVLPAADGRGTDQRMEGGTKAEDTVSTSIGPRLRRLLSGTPGG